MRRVLISPAALISAVSLVTLANAAMATAMPLQMLRGGADETLVAFFAAYFLGFAVGCFSEPPRILRVCYIRALAAAALRTTLAVVIDKTD